MGQLIQFDTNKKDIPKYNTNNIGFGSGDGGDNMQSRIAKLESDVEHIKNTLDDLKADNREIRRNARNDLWGLGTLILTVAVGLASIMAKGFGWL